MWLRDSANQLMPYVDFLVEDAGLQTLFCGAIQRHAYSVLLNPYANAFNFNNSGDGHQTDQTTPGMTGDIFEMKYELDSLAAFFLLSNSFYEHVPEAASKCFEWFDGRWIKAGNLSLNVIAEMQAGTEELVSTDNYVYTFQKSTTNAIDTQMQNGKGLNNLLVIVYFLF